MSWLVLGHADRPCPRFIIYKAYYTKEQHRGRCWPAPNRALPAKGVFIHSVVPREAGRGE
jgi:hypothetical protein